VVYRNLDAKKNNLIYWLWSRDLACNENYGFMVFYIFHRVYARVSPLTNAHKCMAMIGDPEPPACVLSPVTKATLKASEQGPQEAIKLDTEVVVLVDCNPISCLFLSQKT